MSVREVQQAQTVFIYVATQPELHTQNIIEELLAQGKTVAVPRITGPGEMQPIVIEDYEHLESGHFGIPQPTQGPLLSDPPHVVIAPAVAVTKHGDRLGTGGGYYDRFIAQSASSSCLIGLVFDEQIVDVLPIDKHDQPMHLIVTDERVLRVTKEND